MSYVDGRRQDIGKQAWLSLLSNLIPWVSGLKKKVSSPNKFFSGSLSRRVKDFWHFGRVSAIFPDASQNFPMHKISLVSFWIGLLKY